MLENYKYELYYDRYVITDRPKHNNSSGMLVRDKTVKKACLADVAISNSHNLHSTTAKKLQNYTDLKELIRMRQLKTAV